MEVERGRAQQPCPMHPCSADKNINCWQNLTTRLEKNIIKIITNNTTYDADGSEVTLGERQENNLQIAWFAQQVENFETDLQQANPVWTVSEKDLQNKIMINVRQKKIPKLHAESLEMLKKYHVNLASQQKDRESWDLPWERTFQAIVSVTAVKIQFNSPRSVFRSFGRPGILSISELTSDSRSNERVQNLEKNYITKFNSHFTMRYTLISYHHLKVQDL